MIADRCLGDPPACCQRDPLTPEQVRQREARIASALAASAACRPSRCPHCSSNWVHPMFDPDMLLWGCADCLGRFVERD